MEVNIGAYPRVSLKEARSKRDEGLDPSQEKKLKKIQQQNQQENDINNRLQFGHQDMLTMF
jgi:hypothetical protein